jgi:2-methylcitrate dehydratase
MNAATSVPVSDAAFLAYKPARRKQIGSWLNWSEIKLHTGRGRPLKCALVFEQMMKVEQLADFVVQASFSDLSLLAMNELKIRVLDSLGCALGALDQGPMPRLKLHTEEFGGRELCTLIGGNKSAPDRAAFYNGALVRYLDFNDSYLAEGETCHPSDNLAAVLAASEYVKASGRDFLVALAVAYQVQCRLSDAAPVRSRGFDHTTQGAYAVATGVSKALNLDAYRTAHAISISGAAFNALRVTRTGVLSNWKGLAYPNTGLGATHAAFLAMRGITGPLEVFEGNKGFMQTIAGPFDIDWSKEQLDRVPRTILKRYNAEVHSQSSIECALELRNESHIAPHDIIRVDVEIFDVAYHIIGGGEEGSKRSVTTKEEADHSLPYILAVALLDGDVGPRQYAPERIRAADVQQLLAKVFVRPSSEFSRAFPSSMPCRIKIHLTNGRIAEKERRDYPGFFTSPMPWEAVVEKFRSLCAHVDPSLSRAVVEAVATLETISICELTEILEKARRQ